MADTLTTNYSWVMPQDQSSTNTWGVKLNANLQAIDNQVWTNANPPPPNDVTVFSTASVAATYSFANSTAPSGQQLRWQWQMDTTVEGGGTAGSHFNLLAYDNTGAAFATPALSVVRSGAFPGAGTTLTVNASATFAQPLTVQALTVNSALTVGPLISIFGVSGGPATLQFLPIATSGPAATVGWSPVIAGQSRGQLVLNNPSSIPASSLTLDSTGNLNFIGSGVAFKAGGGSWTAPSDARIKTVEGAYMSGLAAVLALRPVEYRYKNDPAKLHIGLVAQEVEAVMPEMVTKGDGEIDGEKVTDLRTLDTTALIFALVNAVRELTAEIDALKAKLP